MGPRELIIKMRTRWLCRADEELDKLPTDTISMMNDLEYILERFEEFLDDKNKEFKCLRKHKNLSAGTI